MISHFNYLFSYSFYIIALKLLLLLVRRCKNTIFIPKELPLPLLKIVKSYKITGNRRENRVDYRL